MYRGGKTWPEQISIFTTKNLACDAAKRFADASLGSGLLFPHPRMQPSPVYLVCKMLSRITNFLGLSPASDPTYGRASLPLHAVEQQMRKEPYTCGDSRVQTDDGHTIYVQTWNRKSPTPVADLVNIHGLGDYGGRMNIAWSQGLCDAGFRLTHLDMPG